MKKAIKNITVQWNWNGDFNALQGFNIALTPENETPHTKAFTTIYVPKNMLNTEQNTFSYTIANVTLDLNQKVIAWVQTVYVENDSDWVSQSGIVVTDDGNATIATGSEINSIQQTITQINVNVNNIQTKISTIESDLNSYSEQLSEFQQTVDGFQTTVANFEEDVEGYRQQVSQFNQTVEGFLTQVSRYEEDVESYNQQLSQITQTTNEIRAEVFDSNGNSRIKQLSDSIELKVEQKDIEKAINEIEIGGRNLIFNSREIEKSSWSSDHQTTSEYIPDEGGYREFTSNRPDANAYIWIGRYVDLDEIELNQEYTISADLRGESGAQFGVRSQSSGGNEVFYKTHNNINPETWTRVYTTFKFTREFTDILMLVRIPTTNHKLHIRRIKLEKGNKATDWTPAPEDIDAQITDIKGTLTSHSTKIEQNAQQIQLRATKTEVDTLSGRINTVESTIQQHAGMIASKVEKSEFDSATNTLRNRISTIEQTADSISLEVSNIKANVYTKSEVDSAIDGIQVGGRNLILDSDKEYSTTSTILSANILGSHRPLVEGETYTLSFDLKADEYTTSNRIFLNNSITVYKTFEFPTEWKRQYVTFIYKADDYQGKQIHPHFYPTGGTKKYARRFKLEKGNKATDWTPAPEDLTDPENIISRINLAPSGVTIQGDKIDFLGNAVFQSLTTTESGTTVIDGGKIATNSILAKSIKANGLKVYNNSGQLMTEIRDNGTIWAKNGYFEGQINATSGTFTGTVNATSGTFNGTIYANSGRIGAWTITNNGLVNFSGSGGAEIRPDSIYLEDSEGIAYLSPFDGLYISRFGKGSFYLGQLVYITYFNVSEGSSYTFTTPSRPEALMFLVRDNNTQTATMVIPRDYISTSYDYTIMTDPDVALDFEFTSVTDTRYTFRYIGDWKSGSNITYVRIYATYR